MAAIKSVGSKVEMLVRRALHERGFRYRLHSRDLPGTPDLAFPRHRAVIFVHGCFWHRHDCHLFRWPETRREFWQAKLSRNVTVDRAAVDELIARGWRVAIFWECSIKGRAKRPTDEVIDELTSWLISDRLTLEIRGSGSH